MLPQRRIAMQMPSVDSQTASERKLNPLSVLALASLAAFTLGNGGEALRAAEQAGRFGPSTTPPLKDSSYLNTSATNLIGSFSSTTWFNNFSLGERNEIIANVLFLREKASDQSSTNIQELLTKSLHFVPQKAAQIKPVSSAIAFLAAQFNLESQVSDSALSLLTTTLQSPLSDSLALNVLHGVNGWKELFFISKYSENKAASAEATKLLAGDNKTLRKWLASERALFVSSGNDRQAAEKNNALLRAAVQSSIEGTAVTQKELLRVEVVLLEQRAQIVQLEKDAKIREQRIADLERSHKKLSEDLARCRKTAEELVAQAKARFETDLKVWRENHVTVAGSTYRVVRVAASGVTVGQQENFTLDVKKGETVLFALQGYNANDKPGYGYRLNQDKHNDEDPTHINPLLHGLTWIAKGSYADWNKRAYVNRNLDTWPITKANFYVVADPLPMPKDTFTLPTELTEQIRGLETTVSESQKTLASLPPFRAN